MIYRNAVIKYKALAFPQAFFRFDFFKVFKNTALEMLDVVKALLF